MLAIVTIAVIHLALVSTGPSTKPGFCSSTSLNQTDKARKVFHRFHNDFRRMIALGFLRFARTSNDKKRNLGPAKNMYEVSWDCDLEKKAQEEISSCILPRDSNLTENTLR
ncbi:hypothetical protein TELCIR_21150 [Teladorsagia circumcincta]|uniref:SCP domain-containing protein n=1 Tax=Teladorsagia circumcincta TaxID=45464 RepID=A0A2G9THM1_TELCI|nr:hypothetical protein TELCIR_21150 [Teladorsagia circumcincta]